ncbi:OmpA family protein [Roseomonas sp. CECT 9278]|uniref:OmpA family protein n=1 Tax=Roseomonas sp. CECT 9278 TaxID=2845823 RepID=UPI001EF9C7A3|nr:OmpA family protein [Roseomonas sp. CECT 9278]CAH0206624.1 Peptidoglycan-associated lipoprotein [Roseomonas sp. CECT 9278]
MTRLALAAALILLALPAAAQPRPAPPPADIAGAADNPLVGRYDGAVQRLREQLAFGEMRIVTAPIAPGGRPPGSPRATEANSTAVAGRITRMRYEGPDGRSPLEVVRNWQQRMEQGGFRTVFSCEARSCGGNAVDLWAAVTGALPGNAGIASNHGSVVYAAMRLERAEGDVWVSLLSVSGPRDRPQTLIDVVEARPMETDRIVFVDAAAMDRAIAATGRVALYGIAFDTDRADPRPDSRPTIEEIAKYLRANPGVSVVVTGHTDSQGGFDHNVDLSRRRAAAIVTALTRDHGIAAARLTPFGAGMAAPVAANDNEQGRAQNRRVEIVRR